MSNQKDPFEPRRLGKFLLLDHIASGGMAELYRAKTLGARGFEKMQVVKSIYQQYTSNEDFRRMFEREAQICSQLQHANIVQVMDFIRVGETYLLSMEFVDGKNVRQILGKAERQREKIPVEVASFVMQEVARGLDYAHKKKDSRNHENLNIIHRDISPQNIMVSYEGAVKIVDFGIAKAKNQAEITRSGVVKGKFAYMSPEQASGSGNLDHRSDIFSAGICLHELLTQERLFAGNDDFQTIRNINECQVPKPSRVNPDVGYELEKIVFKALTKDPDQRYQTAGEMASALQRVIIKTWEHTNSEFVGQWVRKLFAEEILFERKRLKKQEELAQNMGQKPLESVRDTLMPTDGELTQVHSQDETKISQPLTNRQGSEQDEDEPTEIVDQANTYMTQDLPIHGGSAGNEEDDKTASLEMPSHTQMEASRKKKNKLAQIKVDSGQETEKTLPDATTETNRILDIEGEGSEESLEILSTSAFTRDDFQSRNDSKPSGTQIAKLVPPSQEEDSKERLRRHSQPYSQKAPSGDMKTRRLALMVVLLGLLGYVAFEKQFKPSKKNNKKTFQVKDTCVDDPESCLGSGQVKLKAEPNNTTELPPVPQRETIQIPVTLPSKIEKFDAAHIPSLLKRKIAKQGGPVQFSDLRGKKIQVKMFPDNTTVTYKGQPVGHTPFIWVVPEMARESDQLGFTLQGFVGLKMNLLQFSELVLDRRTASGGGLYDFLFEYNLKAMRTSVIDIYVNPSAGVWVDDRYVGQSPIEGLEVSGGTHKVRMVNQLLNLNKTTTIQVEAGKKNKPFVFSLHERTPSRR